MNGLELTYCFFVGGGPNLIAIEEELDAKN